MWNEREGANESEPGPLEEVWDHRTPPVHEAAAPLVAPAEGRDVVDRIREVKGADPLGEGHAAEALLEEGPG
eukprot:2651922-Alexandrium_andersonii.AAC.1